MTIEPTIDERLEAECDELANMDPSSFDRADDPCTCDPEPCDRADGDCDCSDRGFQCYDECRCACDGADRRIGLTAYDITYHVDREGSLRGVTILVAGGGPNIVMDSHREEVRGHWGFRKVIKEMHPGLAEAITDHYGSIIDGVGLTIEWR